MERMTRWWALIVPLVVLALKVMRFLMWLPLSLSGRPASPWQRLTGSGGQGGGRGGGSRGTGRGQGRERGAGR